MGTAPMVAAVADFYHLGCHSALECIWMSILALWMKQHLFVCLNKGWLCVKQSEFEVCDGNILVVLVVVSMKILKRRKEENR